MLCQFISFYHLLPPLFFNLPAPSLFFFFSQSYWNTLVPSSNWYWDEWLSMIPRLIPIEQGYFALRLHATGAFSAGLESILRHLMNSLHLFLFLSFRFSLSFYWISLHSTIICGGLLSSVHFLKYFCTCCHVVTLSSRAPWNSQAELWNMKGNTLLEVSLDIMKNSRLSEIIKGWMLIRHSGWNHALPPNKGDRQEVGLGKQKFMGVLLYRCFEMQFIAYLCRLGV